MQAVLALRDAYVVIGAICVHDAHHPDLARALIVSTLRSKLALGRIRLLGEIVTHAQMGRLIPLVEHELIDFQGKNDDRHDHARYGERDDLVAPAEQPDCLDVGENDSCSLEQACHRDDEEWADQSPKSVFAGGIEVGSPREIAVEKPCRLKAVESADCGDDPVLPRVLVSPVVEWLVLEREPVDYKKAHGVHDVVHEHGKGVQTRDNMEVQSEGQEDLDDVA